MSSSLIYWVRVCNFMEGLFEITQQYVKHVHVARCQDDKFRMCRDTFPIGTIFLVVDFVENYTLQSQNKIQIEYYHSDQVNIMVHIIYRHGADSTEEKRVIFKEYYFYISDDGCHDLDFVQHNLQLFYNHLEDNNIHMEQHWSWSNGCAGQF